MDINFYENICKYNNIEVIDTPTFQTYEIINGSIVMNSNSVSNYNISTNLDVITFIKNNQTKLIYLHLITSNHLRCSYINDKKYLLLSRKEKINQLNKIKTT